NLVVGAGIGIGRTVDMHGARRRLAAVGEAFAVIALQRQAEGAAGAVDMRRLVALGRAAVAEMPCMTCRVSGRPGAPAHRLPGAGDLRPDDLRRRRRIDGDYDAVARG